jgi:hypothetical protein
LSVSVIPWFETLKWTTVVAGGGPPSLVSFKARATACGPVNDSVSMELMYNTLQAETETKSLKNYTIIPS